MTNIVINPRADYHPVPPAPIVYADLPTNLEILPYSGDLAQITNENAIARSLKNIVMTVAYQRPYNPMGTPITSSLFEPFSIIPVNIITDTVSAAIKLYEPRAFLRGVTASELVDQNSIEVMIEWSPLYNQNQIFSTPILLERNR